MFETALNLHNPYDKRSHSILRFFSEDLTEDEKIEFVKSIFKRGAWTLSSSICKSSPNSLKLSEETKDILKQILEKWVQNRIEHSNEKLTAETKNPYLPKKYSYEFREAIFAIKDLDFHPDLMLIIENFICGCYTTYLDKFINSSFWLIIDEFSSKELETFFLYFSNLYIKNSSINIGYFLYIFLRNLAYSPNIFFLSEGFIININELSLKLRIADNVSNYSLLISVLLIDFIRFKELDLSKEEYLEMILPTINSLERGNLDNFELLSFLNKFNYQFESYNFNEEIYSLLYSLENNLNKVDEGELTTKKAILHHFIKSSEEYLEMLVFLLEFLKKGDRIIEFEKFIKLIDRLRISFKAVMWFKEFDSFVPIEGIISRALPDGFGVQLNSCYITEFLDKRSYSDLHKNEFIKDNLFGFANKRTFKKNSDLNEYYSYLEMNSERNSYENSNSDSISKINMFHIWSVNYSSSNKGSVINLMPFNESINDIINSFNVKSFFSCVDLFLANEAFNLLNEVSPFGTRQYSPVLGRLLPSILKPIIKLEFDKAKFWNLLKDYRPNLYNETYIKIKKDVELFKELIDIYNKDEIVKGTIQTTTKGGFFVNIKGQKAFLPGSQIESYGISDYDSYVNQTMDFKIIKIDYVYKSVVISHLIINEEVSRKQRKRIISELKKGLKLTGIVKNITSYGVFIDLGGIDGLIYISNLSWLRIKHPSEVVKLNEKIDVVVIDFDLESSKVDLGYKQLQPNPWVDIESTITRGKFMKGIIVELNNNGVTIEVLPGVEGIAHRSKIPNKLYNKLQVGQEILVKVSLFNYDKKLIRFNLDFKKNNPQPEISFCNYVKEVRVGDILEGVVIEKNNGTGLIRIQGYNTIIAICPARHMKKKNRQFAEPKDQIKFKILEIDKYKKRLIVSHSATIKSR